MEFIKRYWGNKKSGFMVAIRTNTYSDTLAHIQEIVDVLRKDYPKQNIKPDKLLIVVYNTSSFKGIMGVEWYTKIKPNKKYSKLEHAPCKF